MDSLQEVEQLKLEFTPLEFETCLHFAEQQQCYCIRIYSVGVWNNTMLIYILSSVSIRIYSVGVWNVLNTKMAF